MNDTIFYILRFFARNLKWLIAGPLVVALIVAFLTRNISRTYRVESVLYTGFASGFGLESTGENSVNFFTAQNANDNLIAITKSRSTLENVAVRLIAQALVYGNPEENNRYITAASYRAFLKSVPQEVLDLVDRNSFEKTVDALLAYRSQNKSNFIFETINWYHPYYSMRALSKIRVDRVGSSDMLEISYEAGDPSICYQTVCLLNDELSEKYKELRFSETNDVIAYFERELAEVKKQLNGAEDSLMAFNAENRIINYEEQTKSIASLFEKTKLRQHQLRETFEGLEAAVKETEQKMAINSDFIFKNKAFLQGIGKLQSLTTGLTYAELLQPDSADVQTDIQRYVKERDVEETGLRDLMEQLIAQQQTKEGASVSDFVQQWIVGVIEREKLRAELSVIDDVNQEIDGMFTFYSPLGANLKRREREIGIYEQSYLELLHGLNMARLKQKNLQISSASLRAVTDPVYPLDSKPTKRRMLVVLAALVAFVVIAAYLLIVDLLDRTIRRVYRMNRFLEREAGGVVPDMNRYTVPDIRSEVEKAAAAYAVSRLVERTSGRSGGTLINVLSMQEVDGKSFFCRLVAGELRSRGYRVRVLEHGVDFADYGRSYTQAASVQDLLPEAERELPFDYYLLEHPAILHNGVATSLITDRSENVLVCNARNAWTESDRQSLKNLEALTSVRFLPFLNFTVQSELEHYVGLLPPRTLLRKLILKLYNLEFSFHFKER